MSMNITLASNLNYEKGNHTTLSLNTIFNIHCQLIFTVNQYSLSTVAGSTLPNISPLANYELRGPRVVQKCTLPTLPAPLFGNFNSV